MKNRIIVLLFLVGTLFSACDNYLEIEPKGQKIPQTVEEYSALLESDFRFDFPDNEITYLTDEKWVMNAQMVTGDQYPILKANFTFDETADRAKFTESDWLYNNCYKRIAQFNVVINEIGDAKGDEDFKNMVKAQAKILRAYSNFYLINYYSKHYNQATASSDRGVILVDYFDMESNLPQASVQQVYDAIEKDINESVSYLPEQANNTFRPGKAFGYALKAKVHLFKKEFDLALSAAEESLTYNDKIFDMVDFSIRYKAMPWAVKAGYDMEENNLFRYGWNSMGPYFQIVGPQFISKFETGDTRLETFFKTHPMLLEGTMNYGMMSFAFEHNTGGMRSAETLLMKAECLARKGEYQNAINLVNELRVKRIMPANYIPAAATSIKEAMDVIIAERAKEMYLTSNRYWDLKRLNTEPEYAVTLTKTFDGQTFTLKPGSHLYIHPFSIEAITRNSNLEQNSK